MNDIQIRIRECRKAKGYTQKEMACLLGVTQQAYQQIEAGQKYDMRISTLRKLCFILETSADELLGLNTQKSTIDNIPGVIDLNKKSGKSFTIPGEILGLESDKVT